MVVVVVVVVLVACLLPACACFHCYAATASAGQYLLQFVLFRPIHQAKVCTCNPSDVFN